MLERVNLKKSEQFIEHATRLAQLPCWKRVLFSVHECVCLIHGYAICTGKLSRNSIGMIAVSLRKATTKEHDIYLAHRV